MQTIYCFVEEQSEKLNEFINLHDNDSVIHVYSSIIESCEGSLYFCLGELINEYLHTGGKIWFVTDVKSLVDIAKKLCKSLFENIIYIEEETDKDSADKFIREKKDFNEGLETAELIEYEIMIQPNKTASVYMKKILDFKRNTDYKEIFGFVAKLENINIEGDEKQKALWVHYCKLLLHEIGSENFAENYFCYNLLMLLLPQRKNIFYGINVKDFHLKIQ